MTSNGNIKNFQNKIHYIKIVCRHCSWKLWKWWKCYKLMRKKKQFQTNDKWEELFSPSSNALLFVVDGKKISNYQCSVALGSFYSRTFPLFISFVSFFIHTLARSLADEQYENVCKLNYLWRIAWVEHVHKMQLNEFHGEECESIEVKSIHFEPVHTPPSASLDGHNPIQKVHSHL